MTRKLLDDDGENIAVRAFLQLYGGTSSVNIGQMCDHLSRSDFIGYWPEWVCKSVREQHLTKGGAQSWIRYLFSLEQASDSSSNVKGEE